MKILRDFHEKLLKINLMNLFGVCNNYDYNLISPHKTQVTSIKLRVKPFPQIFFKFLPIQLNFHSDFSFILKMLVCSLCCNKTRKTLQKKNTKTKFVTLLLYLRTKMVEKHVILYIFIHYTIHC